MEENGFHQPKNLFPLVGMKDFVEIQYSVLWKLCFDQSCFWLVETIIGVRGKQFSKKDFIFCLAETVCFSQCYFAATRNHYRNKEKTVLRERAHSYQWTTDFLTSGKHFFFSIFWRPLPVFFPSSGKVFFKKILTFGQWKQILELVMASTSRKKAVNKRILFPIDKSSDSTNQNEGFVKKICFHYAKKLLAPTEVSNKKHVKNAFQQQEIFIGDFQEIFIQGIFIFYCIKNGFILI